MEEKIIFNPKAYNGRKTSLSICNYCKNCVGRCSWSKKLIPVEGWKADKTDYKTYNDMGVSYIVHECPKFEDYRIKEGEEK